jgi:NAD(P)-dependent dehydrogenase (short-subunit alcohol dehydrogenase family)
MRTINVIVSAMYLAGPAARAQPAAPAESVTVLVTGSNRGLGFEFAKQYAARGWMVIATVRNLESATELQALAAENSRITTEKLDLLDTAAIKALAPRTSL